MTDQPDKVQPDNEKHAALLAQGRRFFAKPWIFVIGVPSLKFLPPEGPVEVAFAGRSNVGKSSLINALVNQKGLARTSNTPGRTQELNYFVPEGYRGEGDDLPPVAIVDMPGYGFAKAPKAIVEKWTRLIFSYLRGRSTLRRVFILIDARHGIKKIDLDLFKMLDTAAVTYQIVLTKSDKIKPPALARLIEATRSQIISRPAAYPDILATSSQKHEGLDELKAQIVDLF